MNKELYIVLNDLKKYIQLCYTDSVGGRLVIKENLKAYLSSIMQVNKNITKALNLLDKKQPLYKIYMACIHIIKGAEGLKELDAVFSEYFIVKAKYILALIETTVLKEKKEKYGMV